MSAPTVKSKKSKKKDKEFSRFLFDIVNQFSLDEFIKYTNFTNVMKEVLQKDGDPNKIGRLDHFIKRNFKKTVPDETTWRMGGFSKLQLTKEFYESETAARVFGNIFGIKKCSVALHKYMPQSVTVNRGDSRRRSSETDTVAVPSDDDDPIEQIDLTREDKLMSTGNNARLPKRMLLYPRKKSTKTLGSPSGVAEYNKVRKFVEQIPTTVVQEGFNDEINISSTEPGIESLTSSSAGSSIVTVVGPSNAVSTANTANRVNVISDIILVPPTPFRTASFQPNPKNQEDREKVSLVTAYNPTPKSSKNPPPVLTIRSLNVVPSKPKIGPKSVMQQRKSSCESATSRNCSSKVELLQPSLASSKTTSQNVSFSKPKPKIGPKSRMDSSKNASLSSTFMSTQELLNALSPTDPSKAPPSNRRLRYVESDEESNEDLVVAKAKPRIGPKSVMAVRLPEHLMQTDPVIISSPPNVNASSPKPKIGPKSRMDSSKNATLSSSFMSTQELLNVLSPSDPAKVKPINRRLHYEESGKDLVVAKPKSKIGPKSVIADRSPEDLLQDLMQTNPETIPSGSEPQNVSASKPMVKIGTKTRMKSTCDPVMSSTMTSTQELLQDLLHTNPSTAQLLHCPSQLSQSLPQIKTVSKPTQEYAPKSAERDTPSHQLPSAATRTLPSPQSAMDVESNVNSHAAATHITKLPCQLCTSKINLYNELEDDNMQGTEEHLPAECITRILDESPTNCSQSTELTNKFKQWVEEQKRRITEQMMKYIAETEASALSTKHFWEEFVKPDYGNDSSAAETQLDHSDVDDGQLEQRSPAVFNPDQLDVQPDNAPTLLHSSNANDTQSEQQSPVVLNSSQLNVQPELQLDVQVENFPNVHIKVEKICVDEGNQTNSSDVEIIEIAPDEPIEILENTEDLINNLEVHCNDSEEHVIGPFALPQQPIGSGSAVSAKPSTSKRFLTSLPNIVTKKLVKKPLEIVVEAAPFAFPNHDFSQQPEFSPPDDENYEIEECTVTDSQQQRYDLLNNENTLFLSSQLETCAFNAGKPIDPSPMSVQNENTRPMTLKRASTNVLACQPYKRKRSNETINRELNWKVMDIKTVTFKPMPNNIFHMELQLRNNYDTFYINSQKSIRRILHLSDKEWKNVATILTALKGYRYDLALKDTDLMSRVMNCFMQSVPLFVRSNIEFEDFMGHSVEVTEQKPLGNQSTDSAIEPNILKKMAELNKNLSMDGEVNR